MNTTPGKGDPSAAGDRPVVDFDHHFTATGVQPEEAYSDLREKCPVAWTERHGGYWVVTKHKDVSRVLKDHRNFTTVRDAETPELTNLSIPQKPLPLAVPQELSPPEFISYRRLLNGLLAQNVVRETLADRITFWIDWHIDKVIESGQCDLVADLTSPTMGAIVLEWMGFPPADWRILTDSFRDAVGYPPESEAAQLAFANIAGYQARRITEELALRRAERDKGAPRDDVLGYLVAQEIDGEPISAQMVEGMVSLLIAGGVDTTSSASTSTLVHLARHPEHRQQLVETPQLWVTAVDEFVRRYAPILSHARTAVAEVELSGCLIKPGERVLASEASACWDEEEFPNADTVVLDRSPNRHIAFGTGFHQCPGMYLARDVLEQLVRRVLERMPDFRLEDESGLQRYADQSGVAGWITARVIFTPGQRLLQSSMETGTQSPTSGSVKES